MPDSRLCHTAVVWNKRDVLHVFPSLPVSLGVCKEIPYTGWLKVQMTVSHNFGGFKGLVKVLTDSKSCKHHSFWFVKDCLHTYPPMTNK